MHEFEPSSRAFIVGRGPEFGLRLLCPADTLQGVSQDVFDLRVEAAQIIIGPALHGLEHRRIDPEEKRLAIGHDPIGESCRC